MPRNRAEPAPVRPRVDVLRPARLTPQAAMNRGKRQTGAAMRYQHIDRQHRMVMAPVAPAKHVNAVGADIGKGRRLGKGVGHTGIRN